jgi:hypothetical protein
MNEVIGKKKSTKKMQAMHKISLQSHAAAAAIQLLSTPAVI